MSKLGTLVSWAKGIPLIALLGILALILMGSIALGSVVVTRSGHVTRTLATGLEVSPSVDLDIGDALCGSVIYTCTNTAGAPATVTVIPSATNGISITPDKNGFPLAPGASDNVEFTIGFTDDTTTDGDYSIQFQAA